MKVLSPGFVRVLLLGGLAIHDECWHA